MKKTRLSRAPAEDGSTDENGDVRYFVAFQESEKLWQNTQRFIRNMRAGAGGSQIPLLVEVMHDFLDEILHYRGMHNRNARTVMYLNDMAPYFDGTIDIAFPPNMAIFISPGYLADYAWLKIIDPFFAAATIIEMTIL